MHAALALPSAAARPAPVGPSRRAERTVPARLLHWPRALRTPLWRCGLLAVLLHGLALLWLGNVAPGTAEPGRGVAGTLNITLQGPSGPANPAARDEPVPQATPNPAKGDGRDPRWGGAVRERPAEPDSLPGAARLALPAAASTAEPEAVASLAPAALPAPREQAMLASSPAVAAIALPDAPLPAAAALLEPPRTLRSPFLRTPDPAAASAPPDLQRMAAAAVALPSAEPLPALVGTPAAATPVAATAEPAAPAAVAAPVAAAVPAAPAAPVARVAPPDSGTRLGHDVATPAAAASAPPRLDLELRRPRGGTLSRWDTRGVLPVLPRPPETDEALGQAIGKAARSDCRRAHAQAGLAGAAPLVADTLRDAGCKW